MNELSLLNENLLFILEKQNSNLKVSKSESESGEDYVLQGIAAQFGKENNNNRIYEEGEYLPHLDYLKDKINQKRLVGELDSLKSLMFLLKTFLTLLRIWFMIKMVE